MAWFWPAETTRLNTSGIIDIDSLQHGISRLNAFREKGMPEGKFIQIALIGLVLIMASLKIERDWV